MERRIVTVSPDIMSGTPVFAGTRVPVRNLIDYLEGGETIDDFLEGFPTRSTRLAELQGLEPQLLAILPGARQGEVTWVDP
jgi:hypothetical protein